MSQANSNFVAMMDDEIESLYLFVRYDVTRELRAAPRSFLIESE